MGSVRRQNLRPQVILQFSPDFHKIFKILLSLPGVGLILSGSKFDPNRITVLYL